MTAALCPAIGGGPAFAQTTRGLYTDSTGSNIGIGTTTPQAAFVVTNGSVGIGTWTAGYKLDVYGDINTTASSNAIRLNGHRTLYRDGVAYYIGSIDADAIPVNIRANGSDAIVINTSGNVGIGTALPRTKLDVIGDMFIESGNALYLSNTTTQNTNYINSAGTNKLDIVTNGTERMTIDSGGNVGIGTTVPGAKLEIAGGRTVSYPTPGLTKGNLHINSTGTNGDSSSITFSSNNNSGIVNNAEAGIYVYGTHATGTDMYLATTDDHAAGAKARMKIQYDGNVGIGTTNPKMALDVLGTTRSNGPATSGTAPNGDMSIGDNAGVTLYMGAYNASPFSFWFQNSNPTDLSLTYPIVLNPRGGNVGIGTTLVAYKLDVLQTVDGAYVAHFKGSTTSGQSYGPSINAGTTFNDISLSVNNVSGANSQITVYGDGTINLGDNSGFNPSTKGRGNMFTSGDFYKCPVNSSTCTAYTNPDYVFEKYFTGNIVKFKDNPGASTYTGLKPLGDVETSARSNYVLPRVADWRQGKAGSTGVFGGGDAVLASIEESYLYLFDHEQRLKQLEKQNADLAKDNAQLKARLEALEQWRQSRGEGKTQSNPRDTPQ